MARRLFIPYEPQAGNVRVVERANEIIAEYMPLGFVLTLRQLFYQFVARDWLPNTTLHYKNLGTIIGKARDGGLIDWSAIEDRTREVNSQQFWDDPGDIIREGAANYCEDWWAEQPYRVEVWIEKDALLGVIEDVCTELRVPYFATRGNCSQTLMYEAGRRFAGHINQGITPLVLHLADHDPNGIDMTRDLEERLKLYARHEIEVRRIALTMVQVRRYRPPPNPVKEGDTRTHSYRRQFGTNQCWELDALNPPVIAGLIRSEVVALIDAKKWEAAQRKEKRNQKLIERVAANWPEVVQQLKGKRR
jgi:hypothetical protein